MKRYFYVTVIVLINAGIVLSGMPHDYVDCPDPAQAVKMVFEKQLIRPGRWFGVIEETISFPAVGINPDPITCIMVKDKAGDGQGGYATVEGNVGGNDLKIKLRSQVGRGLHFSIAIYTA